MVPLPEDFSRHIKGYSLLDDYDDLSGGKKFVKEIALYTSKSPLEDPLIL